jgi:N-acetylglutamate synthase-like GNAT family acetyltransferase
MIKIRKAIEQDIPRILELYEELTEKKNNASTEKVHKVFGEIMDMPHQEFLVAEMDGNVVGTLVLQIVPNLTHDARPWGIVENMVVNRANRRQGIGHRLFDYAKDRCQEAGCYKIQLLSNKRRQEAHYFYRSMGLADSALGFRLYL